MATNIAELASVITALIAAVTDVRSERIPNWLTFPSLALAIVFWTAMEFPRGGLVAAGGAIGTAFPLLVLFLMKGGGGGDVKLFAALGAWLHWAVGVEALFFALVAAGIYALVRLAWEGKFWSTLANAFRMSFQGFLPQSMRKEITPSQMSTVRLGAPAFAGLLFTLLWNHPELWSR